VSGMSALGGGAETFCSIIVLRLMTHCGHRGGQIVRSLCCAAVIAGRSGRAYWTRHQTLAASNVK
jgi:hypothetical protein